MEKFLGGALAGVFVGALIAEILHRKKPGAFEHAGEAVGARLKEFGNAFKEGYRQKSRAGAGTQEPSAAEPAPQS